MPNPSLRRSPAASPRLARGRALLGAASAAVVAATALIGSDTLAEPHTPAAPTASAPAPRPPWLQRLIRQLKTQPMGNPPQTVWRYLYRGRLVYYLPPQCCDQYSVLFDEDGTVIAAPDGGLTGRGDGRASDFHTVRTQGLLLWRDPRGQARP